MNKPKNLYQVGLDFRKAVLEQGISSDHYASTLLDLCCEREDIKQALVDLGKRKLFKDLPLTGSSAQMILARDSLVREISELYRREVTIDLRDLIEGALGFVDLPDEQTDAKEYLEEHVSLVPQNGLLEFDYKSLSSDEAGDYQSALVYREYKRSESFRYTNDELDFENLSRSKYSRYSNNSLLGQVYKTIVYQLPPFSLFFATKLLLAVQATPVQLESLMNPSELALEYLNTYPWMLISIASVAFWSGLHQARQETKGLFRMELSISAYYMLALALATPAVLSSMT